MKQIRSIINDGIYRVSLVVSSPSRMLPNLSNEIQKLREAEELRKGVLLIYNKLVNTLEQKGLTKIEVRQGDVFNADNHESFPTSNC